MSWTTPGHGFKLEEGKQGLSAVNRDIEGNGGSLGGFSLNYTTLNSSETLLADVIGFGRACADFCADSRTRIHKKYKRRYFRYCDIFHRSKIQK